MSKVATKPAVNPGNLFDKLLDKFKIKNDAALARELGVHPPVISKMRHGTLGVGATMILAIHENFDMPVKEIRAAIGALAHGRRAA